MSLSDYLQISNSIKEKQELIQTEIIDKNYDKNEFLNFCLEIYPNKKDDLDNWTLSELNQIIHRYKTEIEVKDENQDNTSNSNNLNINADTDNITESQKQLQNSQIKINFYQNINTQEEISTKSSTQNTIKEIQCKTLEKTELNDKEITVILKNPKPVETGIFQSNYILYEVHTVEFKWIVERRYSDFIWLRDMLCKFFPRCLVPPLPKKKMGSRRFEVDFVEKRMKFLQLFLNRVLESETFKTSDALRSFLYIMDRNQFEYKMKELNSYTPSIYISETKTLTGKISLSSDSDQNEKYYNNIKNYFNLQNQIFERLHFNLVDFYNYMSLALKQLEEVEKDFDMLNILNTRVQMKEEITKSYEELTIFFKNWKRMLFNQNEVIQKHFEHFFKYIKMEGNCYEELIVSREQIKNKFQSESAKLKAKKDKLWGTMDINKWEITEDMNHIDGVLLFRDRDYAYSKMCTKDTKDVLNLKQSLNYANKANVDELRGLISKYSISFVQNIQEFSNALYPSLNDGLSIWSGLSSFATIQ